jgi:hypothetical protein
MRFIALVVWLGMTGTAFADLTVTATTTPNGGQFAPRNVVVVWVEAPGGAFVKTIDRYSNARTSHLVAWIAEAGANDMDAVSGATRLDHATPITMTWDLRDKAGNLVPDGTYTIRMELADSNSSQPAQNHQGTFTFVKSAAPQSQTALTNGGFTNVSIDFQPVVDNCNNGVVDPGETCDPSVANSCPASCAPSTDACMPNTLVGAGTCTAQCMVQPITACADNDGCCPDGCDGMDNDCGGGGGGNSNDGVSGGCAAGGGGGLALALLVLVRRRRR